MEVLTVLFGKMDIPDDYETIIFELSRCKKRFLAFPSRYLQSRIDELEYALDEFRRTNNEI